MEYREALRVRHVVDECDWPAMSAWLYEHFPREEAHEEWRYGIDGAHLLVFMRCRITAIRFRLEFTS